MVAEPPPPDWISRQSEVGIHERTHAGKATKGRMPQEGGEKKPLFPGKSLPWETANYGSVPVEVEAVCVQCVYGVCTVCVQCVYGVRTVCVR